MTDDAAAYTLTGRDRFAVRCIDAAVKIGTPEFQERYRPVTEELFTHHYIDPTAKPAYQPPELSPISDLESDPLEIVRAHLVMVIEDRKTRDEARQDAERRLEEASAELSEAEARAADLDARLAETTQRLQEREAEIAGLQQQLTSDATTARSEHEAELARVVDENRGELERLAAEHAVEIENLTASHAAELAKLSDDDQSRISALQAERAQDAESLAAERDLADGLINERDQLSAQLEAHRTTIAEIEQIATSQLCDENETDDYTIGSNDAAVLILDALNAENEPAADVEQPEPGVDESATGPVEAPASEDTAETASAQEQGEDVVSDTDEAAENSGR